VEYFKGISGLTIMLGLLGSMLVVERLAPWRRLARVDFGRWARNVSLALYNTVVLSLLPMIANYSAAVMADERGMGLLNVVVVPVWASFVITFLVIDLLVYGQHRVLHQWYLFWRMHRTHHTDKHIDATTSLRFHPFEAVFRTATAAVTISIFGLPPAAWLLTFGIHLISNTVSHSNILLPIRFEKALSYLIVTPSVHRIHHSTSLDNLHANYGTTLTAWDRLFKTYRGVDTLRYKEEFGINGSENIAVDSFANLMLDPFRTPHEQQIPRAKSQKG